MRKSRFLDAPFLKGLFAELREKAHPVYALLCAMPRDVFYIFRDYDFRKRLETYHNPEGYMLTLSEFLENADSYDPQDEFCIYFEGIGEEEDSGRPGRVDICTRDNATVREITELFAAFLYRHCEIGLRADVPFRLTPGLVARCGFTPEDVALLLEQGDRCNTAAAARLQAEYDALKNLGCIVG